MATLTTPRCYTSTAFHLLTSHIFMGEHSLKHWPSSDDPHHCPCNPLHSTKHILLDCTIYWNQHYLLLGKCPSLNYIFSTEAGTTSLLKFLTATQTCLRPLAHEHECLAPPEDPG